MRRFPSRLYLAGCLLTASACGDKVTVPGPPAAPTPKVNGVAVSPASATLSIGDRITMTAAVNADAGVATTVTWSSSGSAATVDASGVVTAVSASPGIAICATSTVNTSIKGCGSVIISAAPVSIPASVSIASITFGNLLAPVNPAAVAGQIDIRLNVNPGNQSITKVVLVVGAIRTDSQTYTAADAAAFRSAADLALAQQTTFPQVLFSVNTAAFSAAGAPTWLNGPQGVSALLYTRQGGSVTAATATPQTSLVFANANTWIVGATVSGAGIANAAGYLFRTGNIAVTATPVIFSGVSMSLTATNTIRFGGACDATGARSIALTAPVAPSTAWTATFTKASGVGSTADFKSYEYRSATCPTFTPEGFALTGIDNNGNQLFAALAPANNAANLFRIDNVPPPAPVTVVNPGGRANSWINDQLVFPTDFVAGAVTDAGIGGVIETARAGTTLAAAIASPDIANATSLPASLTNSAYCLVQYSTDALGNRSPDPGACAQTFGVDRAAPVMTYGVASLAGNARISTATIGGEFIVSLVDTGVVGNSGPYVAGPVVATVAERDAIGSCATLSAGICASTALGGVPPLYTTAIAGTTTAAYFTFTAFGYDNAGNISSIVARTIVHDPVAPALSAAVVNLANNAYDGGTVQSIYSVASDNLDVKDVDFALQFGGLATFDYGLTTVNAFNATPLRTANVGVYFNILFFVRQLQAVTGSGPLTVSAVQKPTAILGTVRDQANNSTGPVSTAIPASSVVTGSATAYPGPAGQTINAWSVTNTATSISDGAGPAAAVNATSVALTADVFGPTATFNAPFARVDFYAQLSGGRWSLIGTATGYNTVDDGSPNGRRHRYSVAWTPGVASAYAANPVPVAAVGSKATGDALMTVANTTITITNP